MNIPAGAVSLPNVRVWDGHQGRSFDIQPSESIEVEFLDAAGNVIAVSQPSPDLADGVEYAEWVGSLGTVTLPTAAKGVRLHHRPDAWGPLGQPNSIRGVDMELAWDCSGSPVLSTTSTTSDIGGPPSLPTTVAPTTVAPTTVAPTTVTPTTIPVVAGNGVLDATANRAVSNIGSNGTAAVAGTSQTRSTGSTSGSGLAYTGSTVRPLILAAVSLIAAGALFVLSARRRRRD